VLACKVNAKRSIGQVIQDFDAALAEVEAGGKKATGQDMTPQSRLERFYATGTDGKPLVADETVANFLQWHANKLNMKQIDFERSVVAPLRTEYYNKLQQAVSDGWLSEGTLTEERVRRIFETPVMIDDDSGLDPSFRAIFGNADAHANSVGAGVITFRHRTNVTDLSKKQQELVRRHFMHEMTHIITGFTHVSSHSMNSRDGERGSYGLDRIFGYNSTAGASLNEAVTEHFARALITGDIDTVMTPRKGITYINDRFLLDRLCNAGSVRVSPRHFVSAMFAGDSYKDFAAGMSTDEQVEVTQLRNLLDKAFPGGDVIERLNEVDRATLSPGYLSIGGIVKALRAMKRASTGRSRGIKSTEDMSVASPASQEDKDSLWTW
jgi:hypothetical protein